MTLKNYIEVGSKKYLYTITPIDTESSMLECREAKICQEFLNEDIVSLLQDLPNLIEAEKQHQDTQDSVIRFRVSSSDRQKIQERLKKEGYTTMSSFIKDKVLN